MEELKVTEYRGMRVLTTQQIAEAYGVEAKKITDNFNNNKSRYVEGKHYKALKRKDLADAHEFVDCYTLPAYLVEQINDCNAQMRMGGTDGV